MGYDCTAAVMEHRRKVVYWLRNWAGMLTARGAHHDASKLSPEEKPMFDAFPKGEVAYGSSEYMARLEAMGPALAHHYASNRHHPEHFDRGISGMTLVDLMEMLADWMAAYQERGDRTGPLDLERLAQRFGIEPQLLAILENTLREEDHWSAVNGGYNAHGFFLARSWSEASYDPSQRTNPNYIT